MTSAKRLLVVSGRHSGNIFMCWNFMLISMFGIIDANSEHLLILYIIFPEIVLIFRVREKKMKMMFRSYLTGAHHVPDERLREVVLEEHLECGCQCDRLAALTCSGTFNESTCECECDKEMFDQVSKNFPLVAKSNSSKPFIRQSLYVF